MSAATRRPRCNGRPRNAHNGACMRSALKTKPRCNTGSSSASPSLWGEHRREVARVKYAAYPRFAAFAEMRWSRADKQDWAGFLARLPAQLRRYRQLGMGYAQSAFAVRIDAEPVADSATLADATNVQIRLSNQVNYGTIHYTLDGSVPSTASPTYTGPVTTASRGE